MASPVSASAKPTGAGTLTCSVGGDVSFNPPLSEYGAIPTAGERVEVATFDLQLTNSAGPDSNIPQPNPIAATMVGRSAVRFKHQETEYLGHLMRVIAACGLDGFVPSGGLKNTEEWSGEAPVSTSHTKLSGVGASGGAINGTSTGSYAGNVSGTLNLTALSSDNYNSVCFGDGTGTISGLTFDASTSTLTIGEPAT